MDWAISSCSANTSVTSLGGKLAAQISSPVAARVRRAVIRTRLPIFWTLPSTRFATRSWRPISCAMTSFPLKKKAEVWAAT